MVLKSAATPPQQTGPAASLAKKKVGPIKDALMPCPQCNGVTRSGERCLRATCKYAPKCATHTKVEMRPSPVHGTGLFAKVDIPRNEIIADYTRAEPLTREAFLSRYPSGRASHVAKVGNIYYDARNLKRIVGGALNRHSKGRNNCRLSGGGKVVTRRSIRAGEELFMAYGRGYST